VRWRTLRRFRDRSVPKLDNLRRARAAGVRVPETWWLPAAEAAAADPAFAAPPPSLAGRPLIVRSGSPTEDTFATSNAGQLLSLPVRDPAGFGDALGRVAAALPRDGRGRPLGAVFVQPLVEAEEAGVAFFGGFYWERTTAPGSNEGLTAGWERGRVERGHLQRDDPWSDWLAAVHRPFRRAAPRIDLEFARDAAGWILLQVRPALFPMTRNETLSLANHREILGDPPSPWIASALVAAGRDALSFFAAVDLEVARWGEVYAVDLAERAWMNFSFFFRLMDRWGLPRTWVTEGVGGDLPGAGPADRQILPGRFLRHTPRLLRLQIHSLRTVAVARRELAALDRRIEAAATLADLHRVNAEGMALAIRTNFAINGVLSGVARLRRLLRLPGAARVATQGMMEEYAALAALPDRASREAGLDRWLAAHGHRGPLESDPARPRFAELRDALLRDLLAVPEGAGRTGAVPVVAPRRPGRLARALYKVDEIRESFRDELMRRWQRLRERILAVAAERAAAGELETAEDVFWLRGEELAAGSLRAAAAAGRARVARAAALDLPATASRDEIETAIAADEEREEESGRRIFPGIPLGPAVVEGRAVKAADLLSLLAEAGRSPGLLGPDAILVVAALEPSWAVVFPRVGGVVAEIGGELSHASILLREARRPALVNCAGIFRAVASGDRLRLDGQRRRVEVLETLTPGEGTGA
jgi:pyruvate,water dikinase